MYLQASRCYYHPERGAVAICAKCGVGICRECAVKNNLGQVLCYQCGNEQLRLEHKAHRKRLKEGGGRFRTGREFIFPGIVGICIIIGVVLLDHFYNNNKIMVGGIFYISLFSYILFSLPFGYILLNDLFAPKYDTIYSGFYKWYWKVWIALLFGWIAFTFYWIRFVIGKVAPRKNET